MPLSFQNVQQRNKQGDFDATMSWNESEILNARRVMFDAAQDMLAGRLSYIEGARKIFAANWTARLDELDPDLLPFVAIVSETDALPFGEMRSHWQAEALEALQSKSINRKLGPAGRRTLLPQSGGEVCR
jgi:hypothetical protein